MTRHQGFSVPPLSKVRIQQIARSVRAPLERAFGRQPYLRMDWVLEYLQHGLEDFELQVLEEHEMGSLHGETIPHKRILRLRRDVYDGLCRGNGRDRFTGAHEVGHLFLHNVAPAFARQTVIGQPIYMNSEWQADNFASYLLIDDEYLRQCRNVAEVQAMFGVSESAARARF